MKTELYVKVTRPESHGITFGCIYPIASFSASDEFDGAEIGDTIKLTLVEMSKEEVEKLGDFTGW